MSDEFQPATIAPQPMRPSGAVGPVTGAAPAEAPPPMVEATPEHHFAAIADDIAGALRHLADIFPAATPLLAVAARIERRLGMVREIIAPPAPKEPEGPQPDHS